LNASSQNQITTRILTIQLTKRFPTIQFPN